MLEKMNEFFNKRIDTYDEHMLNEIESAREFYPFTAEKLPVGENISVLDLGCGTGLELGYYFEFNPSAKVTCVDLSEEMLRVLKEKYQSRDLTVIKGSYFDVPFGENYNAAVSVESLHHFTKDEKIPLYRKLFEALTDDGYFILTDYFAPSEELEVLYRNELLRLKAEEGISDNEFYHYDTPLTVENEIDALLKAGFASVEVLCSWGNTYTLKALKSAEFVDKINER